MLVSNGSAAPPLTGFSRLSPAERSAFLLSTREIFGLQLTADLVTLGASSSGRAVIQSGDELVGLTRAFLYAGAPSLIVSLWNVNKRSSQRLLTWFYRLWLAQDQPQPK